MNSKNWDILTSQITCTASLPAAGFGCIRPLAGANLPPRAQVSCGRTSLCISSRDYLNRHCLLNEQTQPQQLCESAEEPTHQEDTQLDKTSEPEPLWFMLARCFPLPLAQRVAQLRNPASGTDTNPVVHETPPDWINIHGIWHLKELQKPFYSLTPSLLSYPVSCSNSTAGQTGQRDQKVQDHWKLKGTTQHPFQNHEQNESYREIKIFFFFWLAGQGQLCS